MSAKHISTQDFLHIFSKAIAEGLLRQNPDGTYVYRRSSDVVFDRLSAIMKHNGATDENIARYKEIYGQGTIRQVKDLWNAIYQDPEETPFPELHDDRFKAIRAKFGPPVTSPKSPPAGGAAVPSLIPAAAGGGAAPTPAPAGPALPPPPPEGFRGIYGSGVGIIGNPN